MTRARDAFDGLPRYSARPCPGAVATGDGGAIKQ